MKQDCPFTKQPCHSCKRGECNKELDLEAQAFCGTVTPITRDVIRIKRDLEKHK